MWCGAREEGGTAPTIRRYPLAQKLPVMKDGSGSMAEVAILVSVSTRCLKEPGEVRLRLTRPTAYL